MGNKGREIVANALDINDLLKDLNDAYANEWMAYYSYWYMMNTVSGPGYEDMQELLEKIAKVEIEHAGEITGRMAELDANPASRFGELEKLATFPYPQPPVQTDDYNAIINTVTGAEANAISLYQQIANKVQGKDHVTYQLIMHILSEEVQHEEMFENLRKKMLKAKEPEMAGAR